MTLLILALILLSSCGGDSEPMTGNPADPSNLVLDVVTSDNNSGIVNVTATAINATEFEFDMGEDPDLVVRKVTGNFAYTYKNTGSYTITVKAIGSNGRFVKAEKRIAVETGEPLDTGAGYTTPLSYAGMDLIWNDEFSGTSLNLDNWTYINGDGCPDLCGWGNNELEFYRPENSNVSNGVYTITAKEEFHQNRQYTSGKIDTKDKQAFIYGRFDIRARLPRGQGMWPAIWLLGQNISSVGWPESGEIDVMEVVGGGDKDKRTHGTAHWNQNGQHASSGDSRDSPTGEFHEEFHVFSILWNEDIITWYVDDIPYYTLSISADNFAAFHKPFYFILNLAIGGNWPGSPNDLTEFPATMEVDYIRVFQDK